MSEEAGENTSTVSFPRADTQEAGAMNGRPLLAIQSLFMSFFLSALPLLPPNPNKKKKKLSSPKAFQYLSTAIRHALTSTSSPFCSHLFLSATTSCQGLVMSLRKAYRCVEIGGKDGSWPALLSWLLCIFYLK